MTVQEKVAMEELSLSSLTYVKIHVYGVAHQLEQLYQQALRQLISMSSVENSILCQSSTSIPSTPGSRPSSVTGHCGQLNTPSTGPSTPSRSSTPLTGAREYERSEDTEVNALEEGQDQENKDPMGTLKERRDLLNARLKGYMQEKLKRKLTVDTMLLNIALEVMEIKKRITTKIEDVGKQQAENIKKMTTNMEQMTSSIVEGFPMLRDASIMCYAPTICATNWVTRNVRKNAWSTCTQLTQKY